MNKVSKKTPKDNPISLTKGCVIGILLYTKETKILGNSYTQEFKIY